MEGNFVKPDLEVPEQRTASLSFCETTPKAFRLWTKQLPMVNIGEASRQLYHAILELNQVFLPPQQRMLFLEAIREQIHFVCNELSRHFLGLAIALPEKQRKIANLTQALQLHLASGYKLCLLEYLDNGGLDKHRRHVSTATHRIISELGATILRSHQLYCPSPRRSWLDCHQLFLFAWHNNLAGQDVEDSALTHQRSSTIADSYKRVLLLGCSRPNQLRQNELTQVYELFESWTPHCHCGPDTSTESLFIINPEQDKPPVYRSLQDEAPEDDSYGFDTTALAGHLSELLQTRHNRQPDQTPLNIPGNVSDTLLMHLNQALGILAKRNFNRISSQGSLEICVGLSATHYFVSGQKTFSEFLEGNESNHHEQENLFIKRANRQQDAWSQAHDVDPSEDRIHTSEGPITFRSGAGNQATTQAHRNRPRSHHALLINTSPGGYCVAWEQDIPASLQAGEILGVREQSSHPWSIAVVRWLRQIKNQGTQAGIELLAPSAAPCAVRLIQKVGNSSEYLRGLLLPEINVVNQAATLVTPRMPFQTGHRISLLHDGCEDQGQLLKKVSATGSISQFELKLHNSQVLSGLAKTQSGSGGTTDDEFDSLWPSL
ncbi:MAG: GTPase [Pseudomonadota bacterium]